MKKHIFTLGASLAVLATFAMPVSALAYSYYPQTNYWQPQQQYQYPLLYGPTSYSQYQQYSYYQSQYYNNYDYGYQQPTYYTQPSYYYPQQYTYYEPQTYYSNYGNYQPYDVSGYNISYNYPNVYTHGW